MAGHGTVETFVETPALFRPELDRRVAAKRGETRDLVVRFRDRGDPVERVLDVACGPGVHAVDLAEAGFRVDGFDVVEPYLEAARARAESFGVADRTRFFEHDMRSLGSLDRRYDAVTNRYGSFGYFDDATNRAVLEACHDALRPGGVLALELRNREGLLADFDPDVVRELDGQLRVERRAYDPETGRLRTIVNAYDAESDAHLGSYETDVRLYAPVEMTRLLDAVGFDVDIAATFAGDPVARRDEWFVAFGRRPA